MAGKHVFYLAPSGLTAFVVSRRQIEKLATFEANEEGFQAFGAYLGGLPFDTRAQMLADLPEETQCLETLPFVRGGDRAAMLARRLEHLFGDTPFRSHLSLGRRKDGRRDERLLFAALTRPAAIQPWLQRILHAPCVLEGIVSTSFVSRALALPLHAAATPFLFAHLTPAGLRVSCFNDAELRFSRLTAFTATQGQPDIALLRDEIRRSYDYLVGQRILPRDKPTPAHCLFTADALPGAVLAGAITGLDFQPISIVAAADSLGMRHEGADADSLPLLLQVLAGNPRLPQFAPAEALAGHRRRRLDTLAGLLAGVGFLACLGMAGFNLLAAREQRLLAEARLQQIAAREARLNAVIAATPLLPLSLETLRVTLQTAQLLATSRDGPEPALRRLAQALAGAPGFDLETLEWQLGLPPRHALETAALPQMLHLHFRLPAGTDQVRQRVDQARAILAALATLPGARIRVIRHAPEMSDAQPLRVLDSPQADAPPQLEVEVELSSPFS